MWPSDDSLLVDYVAQNDLKLALELYGIDHVSFMCIQKKFNFANPSVR